MKSRIQSPMIPALAALLVASCVSTFDPDTGEVSAYAPAPHIVAQGEQSFTALKRKKGVSTSGAHASQVNRVAARLKRVVPTRGTAWEFVVFNDSTPNAFALPGGKIGINTGMFKVARTDGELAAVLGHEMAHVTLNHGQNQVANQTIVGLGTAVLGQVLADGGAPAVAGSAVSAAGQYGVMLPYSRHSELQADKLGTIYMAKAGYDPQSAVTLWRRFGSWKTSQGMAKQPEFLQTHPVDDTRIRELQAFMPKARQHYKR